MAATAQIRRPLQPAAVGFHRVSSGSGSDGSSGAEGAPQAAHRKLHGGAAARARVGEAGAVNAKGGAGARPDDVEREKLVLNQARVRLGAQVLAPFEGGGLRGCVVRKKAPEKKHAGDREGRGVIHTCRFLTHIGYKSNCYGQQGSLKIFPQNR